MEKIIERSGKTGFLLLLVLAVTLYAELTVWSQADIAVETDAAADPNDPLTDAKQQQIDKLLTDFSEHADLPKAVIRVAGSCLEKKLYRKAAGLYQYFIDNFPDQSRALRIQAGLAVLDSDIGIDPNAAEVDVDSLIADNKGDTELAEAVFDIAKMYYKRSLQEDDSGCKEKAQKHLLKSISSFESVLNIPESAACADPETLIIPAQAYRRSGQFQEAVYAYEKVPETFPNYQYRWHIQFAIGRCYQRMKEKGLISVEEANSLTKTLYESLLWNYPACKAAKGARDWLDELAGTEQGGVK